MGARGMSQDEKLFVICICLVLIAFVLVVVTKDHEARLNALEDACGVEQVEG